MNDDVKRWMLAYATESAEKFVELVRESCDRIVIAGSIRRKRKEVKDIEIVALPLYQHHFDLFGGTYDTVNLLDARLDQLRLDQTIAQAFDAHGKPRWGERYKKIRFGDFAIDLFTPTPISWGYILAIRTGPASLSRRYVTPKEKGGYLPLGCRVTHGEVLGPDGSPYVLPTEKDFFDLLGLPELPPEQRFKLGWDPHE